MKFQYTIKDKQGESQTGLIDAYNKVSAIKLLQQKGFIVVSIKELDDSSWFSKDLAIFQRVKKKEVFVFFRQLAILVGAGVPLVQSLEALGRQVENEYFRKILSEVTSDVDGGTAFSDALADHPKVFSDFSVNLMKTAEVSGRLGESLEYLAGYLEREYYLLSKVRGAMVYPLFILGVFAIIALLVIMMVIPELSSILKESGQELPLTTKIVVGTSEFLRQIWWLFLLLLIGGGLIIRQYIKTEKGRLLWDEYKIKIPLFGPIVKKTYLARLSDNLNALLKGGVSVVQSLTVSANVVGNAYLKKILIETRDELKMGNPMSSSLANYGIFPPLFIQMFKTGEKTGKLDVILGKLSDFYNKEVRNVVDNLTQLIEPVLIVVLGIGVALLVFSVFMPIYNMTGAIQ